MEPGDLDVATEFCKLVQTSDLFEYVGVSADAPQEDAQAALTQQRMRMQGMQNNPKFKDAARFLLRHFRQLERVLAEPSAHLKAMRQMREEERMPMLRLALEGVMADGRVSAQEQAFLRDACVRLGISHERYLAELHQAVTSHGVVLEREVLPEPSGGQFDSPEAATAARLRGADSATWWDASFTRLLLECIPGGPSELVDVHCRTGLSAATILPERPQLSWVGIDRSADRLNTAREILGKQSGGTMTRIRLLEGSSDSLPVEPGSMDTALAIRALANVADTRAVLTQMWRVLRIGGRAVVAEPDELGESFYFGGALSSYNAAFRELCEEVDRGRPSQPRSAKPGLSIGPSLGERLSEAGFAAGTVRVHAAHNLRVRKFGPLARKLRRYPTRLAETVGLQESPKLKAVLHETDALERQIHAESAAVGGYVLPMFLVVGLKKT